MAQRVVIPGFRKIETSGGDGGATNYEALTNKPLINSVPLVGNLKTSDLKLTDSTLTEEGVPAEAKTVGQKLEEQSTSLTELSEQLGKHTVKSDVPENAVFTDNVYDDTEVKESISQQSKEIMDIKMLGWSVPKECPMQNSVSGNVFTQKIGRIDLGSLDWTKYDVTQGTLFRASLLSNMKSYGNDDVANAYTNGYTASSSNKRAEKTLSMTANGIDLINSSYTDADTFKQAMQGQYLYYELATYNTITIDGNEEVVKVAEDVNTLKKEITNIQNTANFSHNITRNVPKDITSYITDGTFYKRLNGTDGFELFEDIFVGDYIEMSRKVTCPNSEIAGSSVEGSKYVTIAGIDTLMYNGKFGTAINYHHVVMVPGKGFGGDQHFGVSKMNETATAKDGYFGSSLYKSVIGTVATAGSTDSTATINQQLLFEFGEHLKTIDEWITYSINTSGINRFGKSTGCSDNSSSGKAQAILMGEIEVYGSTVWSSSGFDIGVAKKQLPLFMYSRSAMNNQEAYYWLKAVASGTQFCVCDNQGFASYANANTDSFVRPRFVLA